MKIRTLTALAAMTVLTAGSAYGDTLVFEDFEDATVTYTTSVADDLSDIAANDYFGRIAPDTSTPPATVSYSNLLGSGYYGAQDTDGTLSGNIDLITLDITGVDISNHETLMLSFFVATDDASDGNQDWDLSSSLRVQVQIDGGGFQNIFAIESEIGTDGNETNEQPRVDTDFNGVGDGAAITDTFTQYAFAVSNGSVLDVRFTIEDLDSGDEDIAIDDILVSGALVPEPGSLALLGLGGLALLRRRRD